MHFTSVDTRGGQRGADSRGFENERKTKNQNKKQTWADSFFPRLTASTAREVPGSHDVTDTHVAKGLSKRFLSAAMSGGKPPTIESSEYKLFTTSLSQRVCKDALDVTGVAGQIREGQDDAPLRGRFEGAYRATLNETVGGGSSEIQKNIIARRKLGLPKNF